MSRERRRFFLEEEPPAEPGHYGCPMLVRTRFHVPAESVRPVMRCALGWALHNELEVTRCVATDVVMDCWKLHPELTPVVVLPVAEAGAETELDPTSAKVAGD